ncbi:MAG: hypothetical protein ACODAQ_03830 [Phycisphaeraceae bacterium]
MLNVNNKAARIGIVVLGLAGFAIYEFGIKAPQQRAQVYEGTVVEVYRDRDEMRGVKKPGEPEYRYYTHYWKIETAEGETMDVEVPHGQWRRAEADDPVKKVEGERYPMLMTEDAIEGRKAMEHVFGGQ